MKSNCFIYHRFRERLSIKQMYFIFEDNSNEHQNCDIYNSFSQDYSSDLVNELITPTSCRDNDLWFAKKKEETTLNSIAQCLSKANDNCDASSIACDISSVIGEYEHAAPAEPTPLLPAQAQLDSPDFDLQFIVDEVFKCETTKESKK